MASSNVCKELCTSKCLEVNKQVAKCQMSPAAQYATCAKEQANTCLCLCNGTGLHQDVLDKSIEIVHNPGPGTYNHQGSVGQQPLSTSATSARAVIGTQKREEKPEITALEHAPPGPGRYDFHNSVGPDQNASQRQSFPAYSFGLRHMPDDPSWKHAPGRNQLIHKDF